MSFISFFKQRRQFRSLIAVVLTLAVLNLTSGCSYFRVKKVKVNNSEEFQQQIDAFNTAEKYIVIHHQKDQYHFQDVNLNADDHVISGTIRQLDQAHTYKKIPEVQRSYKYKPDKQDPLSEVHLYLKNLRPVTLGEQIKIPLKDIESIGVTNKDAGSSIAMVFFTTLGVLVFASIVITLIKGSCPFVYTHDGSSYTFVGELYPGIIIPNAQRDDFIKLENLAEHQGDLKLLITNELLEIQHTDLTELLVYDHPEGTEMALTPEGEPLVFHNIVPPLSSYTPIGTHITDLVSDRDDLHYSFNGTANSTGDISRDLIIQFEKERDIKKGKLFLSVKNSFWLDHIFGQMNAKFGMAYPEFQKRQLQVSAEESEKWMLENHLYLSVSIKNGEAWEEVSKIPMVGPIAFRDIGIPLDINDSDQELITVKISSGFMFWDLDFAGVDFSPENDFSLKSIRPYSAITEQGIEEVETLLFSDRNYLTQNGPGHYVEVLFKAPESTEQARSYFLKNRGYYTYLRDYKGIPDIEQLRRFSEPGYFANYSEREFHRIFESNLTGEYITENAVDEN